MTVLSQRLLPSYLLQIKREIHQHWAWHVGFGVGFIALGSISLHYAIWIPAVSMQFFSAILASSGLILMSYAKQFWHKNWLDFSLHSVISLLYLLAGLLLLCKPMISTIAFTLGFVAFYVFLGLSRTVIALTQPLPAWLWLFFNGLISLTLSGYIMFYWPVNRLWLIGLWIGSDLILIGTWLSICGWRAKKWGALSIQRRKI